MKNLIKRFLLTEKVRSVIKKWSPILYIFLGFFITKSTEYFLYVIGEENRAYNNMMELMRNHNDIDKDALYKMALLGNEKVRISVAKKNFINQETFSLLSKDISTEVRENLASHPRLPLDEAKTLALDWSKKVRIALVKNNASRGANDESVLKILSYSNEEIVDHISNKNRYLAKRIAAESEHIGKETMIYLYSLERSDDFTSTLYLSDNKYIRVALAANKNIYNDLAEQIIADGNFTVISALAKNRSITNKILPKLINYDCKETESASDKVSSSLDSSNCKNIISYANKNKQIRESGNYDFDNINWCIENKKLVFKMAENEIENKTNKLDLANTGCGKSIDFLSTVVYSEEDDKSYNFAQVLCENKAGNFDLSDISQNTDFLIVSIAPCLSASEHWASEGIAQNIEILKSNPDIATSLAQFSYDNGWGKTKAAQNFDVLSLNDGAVVELLSLESDKNGWATTDATQDIRILSLNDCMIAYNLAEKSDKNGWGDTLAAIDKDVRNLCNGNVGELLEEKGF